MIEILKNNKQKEVKIIDRYGMHIYDKLQMMIIMILVAVIVNICIPTHDIKSLLLL